MIHITLMIPLIRETQKLSRIKPIDTLKNTKRTHTRDKHKSSLIKTLEETMPTMLEDTLQIIREKEDTRSTPTLRKPPRVPTPLGRRSSTPQIIREKRTESEPSQEDEREEKTRPTSEPSQGTKE